MCIITIFSRLSVAAAVCGIAAGVVVSFMSDNQSLEAAEAVIDGNGEVVRTLLFGCAASVAVALSGLFVFGFLAAFPLVFYRVFSLAYGVAAHFALRELPASYLFPMLLPPLAEGVILTMFAPSAAEFSLSLINGNRAGERFGLLRYLLTSTAAITASAAVTAVIHYYSAGFKL